ncbi:MAG: hypothetical protein EA398_07770 [Deltaproteobacteria bacterium]|nr:MAG: hypothetical protein EA398_07770 [Deltaproteobacteria bacterium]
MDWMLCLDESGDFARREDVVVLGVLVEHGALGARAEAALRPLLLSAFPWFDWPLHGRVVADVTAHVVRVQAFAKRAKGDELGERLLRFARHLGERPPERMQAAVQRVRSGKEQDLGAQRALRAALRNAGHTAALRSLQREIDRRCRQAIRAAAVALEEAPLAEAVVLSGAEEEARGSAIGEPDRYLHLLMHAVRRAVSVLLAGGGPARQRLLVSPLQRQVRHPVLGAGRHMDRVVLQQVIAAAVGSSGVARFGDRSVQVQPGPLYGFHQQDLPLGHALADLLAAEVLVASGARHRPWAMVAERFHSSTAFVLEASETGLPLLAATGAASSPAWWLDDAVLATAPGEGWPFEQAAQWRGHVAGEERS